MASTSVVPNVLFPEPCWWVCVDLGGTLKNAMRTQVTLISWERTGDEAVALVTGGRGLRAVRPQPPRNPDVLCVSPSWLLGTHEDLSLTAVAVLSCLYGRMCSYRRERRPGLAAGGVCPGWGHQSQAPLPTFLRALPPMSVREATGFCSDCGLKNISFWCLHELRTFT